MANREGYKAALGKERSFSTLTFRVDCDSLDRLITTLIPAIS